MPVLSAHLGYGSNSFLLISDAGEISLYVYPYSYNPVSFGHSFKPRDFYRQLFEKVFARWQLDPMSVRVLIVTSLPKDHFVDVNPVHFCVSRDLDLRNSGFSVLYLKRASPHDLGAHLDKDSSSNGFSRDILANMAIYSNLTPSSLEDNVVWGHKVLKAHFLRSKSRDNLQNILFTGPALTGNTLSRFFKYSLAFSAFQQRGLYRVFFDNHDLLYTSSLVRQYDKKLYAQIEPLIQYAFVGTLFKCHGRVECLVKKDVGAPDLHEVAEEDLFVLPLDTGEHADVFLKGSFCKSLRTEVEGGDLGFVVDTRTTDFWQVRHHGLLHKYRTWLGNLTSYCGSNCPGKMSRRSLRYGD